MFISRAKYHEQNAVNVNIFIHQLPGYHQQCSRESLQQLLWSRPCGFQNIIRMPLENCLHIKTPDHFWRIIIQDTILSQVLSTYSPSKNHVHLLHLVKTTIQFLQKATFTLGDCISCHSSLCYLISRTLSPGVGWSLINMIGGFQRTL